MTTHNDTRAEKLAAAVEALKACFRETISEYAGVPFEMTKVSLPSDEIWKRYAEAVIESLGAYHHQPPARDESRGEVGCLPPGHVILEQADMMDGRVSQTVRASDGTEYQRVVHADEAYGADE